MAMNKTRKNIVLLRITMAQQLYTGVPLAPYPSSRGVHCAIGNMSKVVAPSPTTEKAAARDVPAIGNCVPTN
jgi:hypothetical protein